MNESVYENVLAIDTATMSLQLALSFGMDRLVKLSETAESSHGQRLMRQIDNLFSSANLERTDLQAIAVCTGPGSFTGLRIGLAAAKGIAVSMEIPVIGISLFEIAAYKLCMRTDGTETISVLAPFKRDAFAMATVSEGNLSAKDITVVSNNETALRQLMQDGAIAIIGTNKDVLPVPSQSNYRTFAIEYDATDLLNIGRERLNSGKIDNLELLEPLYVQPSQAELNFVRKNTKR